MPLLNKRDLIKWRDIYTVWDAPCLGEGLYLHVHFDEKDDVKRLGGRWHPGPEGEKSGHWWMPSNNLNRDCPIEDEEHWGAGGSGTIQDWLNNHKMIAGQYGTMSYKECQELVDDYDGEFDVIRLIREGGLEVLTVSVYECWGVVRFDYENAKQIQYRATSDARDRWNELIKDGYRKIVAKKEVSS